MAMRPPVISVWMAMDYKPPRGKCNHKTSIMMPACPCLRFMLHPVKAATSFECDGCGHHASFHSLENPSEDAVLKKWAERAAEEENEARQAMGGASKKRKLLKDAADAEEELIVVDAASTSRSAASSGRSGRKAVSRKAAADSERLDSVH